METVRTDSIDETFRIQAFFALLRAGLWGAEKEVADFRELDATEWDDIYAMARQQTVRGLVYAGICMLPYELMPADSQLMRWAAAVEGVEQRNRHMNRVLGKVCLWFESQGLSPVVMKGQGVAQCYEQPLQRECGDIDLYFASAEENTEACRLLKEKGVSVSMHADGSYSYVVDGVSVEHHRQLVDLTASSACAAIRQLEGKYGFPKVEVTAVGEKAISIPSPTEDVILQNAHILKHALGWGVGLRQLCDVARLCHRRKEEVNGKEVEEVCRLAGITDWTSLLHSFLIDYMGMPEASLPFATKHISSEPLLYRILRGGNFGQHRKDMDKAASGPLKRKIHTACSFAQNAAFALRYAPGEGARTFWTLLRGQF